MKVFILGGGGHGSELASYIRALTAAGTGVELAGFIDEGKPVGPLHDSVNLGGFDALARKVKAEPEKFAYISAVGDNATRVKLIEKIDALQIPAFKAWTLMHPSARIGDAVSVGHGTCLAPGSVVTTRTVIGKHCILNVHASVSHDCAIGDFTNINPGAIICGNVKIGRGCYIGAGAVVIDKVTIGDWTVVGAGSVVIHDLPERVTVVGVPSRTLPKAPHG